jgi:hypothetical protein
MPDYVDVPEYIRLQELRSTIKVQIEEAVGSDLYRVLRSGEREIDKLFSYGDPLTVGIPDLEEIVDDVIKNINRTTDKGMDLGRDKLIELQNSIKEVLQFDYPIDFNLLPYSSQDSSQTIAEMRAILSNYRSGKLTSDRTRRILKSRLNVPINQADAFAITQLAGFDNETSKTIASLGGLRSALYWGGRGPFTRPFCVNLIDLNRVWTEAQIRAMDNHQGLPVIRYCGGYRCVHEWMWVDAQWKEVKGILRKAA